MALQQQDDSFSPLPKLEFDVRTGQPLKGVSNTTSDSSVTLTDKPKTSGKTNKGLFLRNRLSKLYADPVYQKADDNLKQYYKEKAYNTWVIPYYKHINMEPPTKEEFITGKFTPKQAGNWGWYQGLVDKLPGIGYATLKETSKITGGLAGLMSYVGKGIDWIAGSDVSEKEGGLKKEGSQDKNLEQYLKSVQTYFKGKEDYYDKQLEATNDGHAPTWTKNPEQKIAQVVTQGVFFEATGAAKAAKVLQVANPRTAGLLFKMAKSSWNTSVGFGLWSASQGELPKEIAESAGTGAVLGPMAQFARYAPGGSHLEEFHDMLKTMFKYGGPDAAKMVINDAVTKASNGHGKEFVVDVNLKKEQPMSREELKIKVEDLLKSLKETEEAHAKKTIPFAKVESINPLTPESKVASSAISIRLMSLAQDKYGKTFDKLPWIQQRAVINKFMASDALAAQMRAQGEKPSAEVIHTMVKEQQEKLNQVSPVAAEVDKKVGEFVTKNGGQPAVQKIKATMPRHNTTIDSPIKDVHARISFLTNQLRSEKDEAVKKEISNAIKEEKELLTQIKTKAATRTKPGAALINDTIAFKGDDYLIRPAEKTDAAIFRTWREDKLAGDVYKQIVESSPIGMMDRKAQAIMTSMQAGSMLEMFAKDGFQDTLVLHHAKYGPIGGANYGIIEDRGGALGKTLMLNWIAVRPNVVAKVYDTPGAGQTLFLSILDKARVNNAGVELHSAPSAENFYKKMGMTDDGEGNFKFTSEQVVELLRNKGLLMGLLGAGIGTYAATPDQLDNDVSVIPKGQK